MNDFYKTREFIFTSESVSWGHPDKIADQISDAILDEYLKDDPHARVAVEAMVTTNRIILAGEVRGSGEITKRLPDIARKIVQDVGYDFGGFDYKKLDIANYVHEQSPHIAQGVDAANKEDEGAGDQGLMFGYACDETEELMPAPIYYSHRLLENIFSDIKTGKLQALGPDAKTQITVQYKGNEPIGTKAIVLSIQHREGVSQSEIRELLRPYLLKTLPKGWMCEEDQFYINPTGKFVIGGPDGDAGLTGRKIIVDTYGGAAPHGGGAFSGKDPSKVDRSAAYMARYIAKNIVGNGLASACTIQLSYAIGVSKPISFYINTHGTGKVNEYELTELIQNKLILTPWGIRQHLGLGKPIYKETSTYGHFGRKPVGNKFPWEKIDLKF